MGAASATDPAPGGTVMNPSATYLTAHDTTPVICADATVEYPYTIGCYRGTPLGAARVRVIHERRGHRIHRSNAANERSPWGRR